MHEHDTPRSVFGEIMTDTSRSLRDSAELRHATDAQFETVAAEPTMPATKFCTHKNVKGMDFLTRRPVDEARLRSGGPLFWASSLILVVLVFWLSGGHELVRYTVLAMQDESPPPLRIADVESRVEHHNGRDVLFVNGAAENRGADTRPLPPIEIAVIATDGAVTRYYLGTSETELTPGGRYAFSSRLEPPRSGVKIVAVTFQEGSH